jgi:HEAT repeat protein
VSEWPKTDVGDVGEPLAAEKPRSSPALRIATIAVVAAVAALFFPGKSMARAAWQEIAQFLSLEGEPTPASANVLSEHEMEYLDNMLPQAQAELLLERSLNHYKGANDEIARRVGNWRGKITLNERLDTLFRISINSDDLRVRAAGIEVDIAARNLDKTSDQIDRLESAARNGEQGPRANALWDIGLLGNRGVDPDKGAQIILASVHDPNENIRYWAVEALAYLGTDAIVGSLLEVFHDDPSPMIRERAACGLAQSGMLSEKQRRSAVPRLLDFASDESLDDQTRKWVFQALRDITGQSLPHDAAAWRSWYESGASNWNPVTRDSE